VWDFITISFVGAGASSPFAPSFVLYSPKWLTRVNQSLARGDRGLPLSSTRRKAEQDHSP
jgi:hypothetical protein